MTSTNNITVAHLLQQASDAKSGQLDAIAADNYIRTVEDCIRQDAGFLANNPVIASAYEYLQSQRNSQALSNMAAAGLSALKDGVIQMAEGVAGPGAGTKLQGLFDSVGSTLASSALDQHLNSLPNTFGGSLQRAGVEALRGMGVSDQDIITLGKTFGDVKDFFAGAGGDIKEAITALMEKDTFYKRNIPLEDQFRSYIIAGAVSPVTGAISERQLQAGTDTLETLLGKFGIEGIERSSLRKAAAILGSPAFSTLTSQLPELLGLGVNSDQARLLTSQLPDIKSQWDRLMKGHGFAAKPAFEHMSAGVYDPYVISAVGEAALRFMQEPSYENGYLDSGDYLQGLSSMMAAGYKPYMNVGGSVFANKDAVDQVEVRNRISEYLLQKSYNDALRAAGSNEKRKLAAAWANGNYKGQSWYDEYSELNDAAQDLFNKVLSAGSPSEAEGLLDAQNGMQLEGVADIIRGSAASVGLVTEVQGRTEALKRVSMMLRRVPGAEKLLEADPSGFAAATSMIRLFGGSSPNGDFKDYADRTESALFYAHRAGVSVERLNSVAKMGAQLAQQNGISPEQIGDALTQSMATYYTSTLSTGRPAYVDEDRALAQAVQTTFNLHATEEYQNLAWVMMHKARGDSEDAQTMRRIQEKVRAGGVLTDAERGFLSDREKLQSATGMTVEQFNTSFRPASFNTGLDQLDPDVKEAMDQAVGRGQFDDFLTTASKNNRGWQNIFEGGDTYGLQGVFAKQITLLRSGVSLTLAEKILSGTATDSEQNRVRNLLHAAGLSDEKSDDILNIAKGLQREQRQDLGHRMQRANNLWLSDNGLDRATVDGAASLKDPIALQESRDNVAIAKAFNLNIPSDALRVWNDTGEGGLSAFVKMWVQQDNANYHDIEEAIKKDGAAFSATMLSRIDPEKWEKSGLRSNLRPLLEERMRTNKSFSDWQNYFDSGDSDLEQGLIQPLLDGLPKDVQDSTATDESSSSKKKKKKEKASDEKPEASKESEQASVPSGAVADAWVNIVRTALYGKGESDLTMQDIMKAEV